MTATHGPCLGCKRHTRLRLDFCQRCEGKSSERLRAAWRQIAHREQLLDRNVRKLEANARHYFSGMYQALGVLAPILPPAAATEAGERIKLHRRALDGERLPLTGRIARQHAAIVALRRKYSLPWGFHL